ncbi:MAG: capsular biosynthesis protein [Chlorobiaceae bacterium]|nr:capsular biosynthesis protein [Chlorobiaceae bacterium]
MNILITGYTGFIGKNLVSHLKATTSHNLFLCDRKTSEAELEYYCENADFVYHLAGVNRPLEEDDFEKGNTDFTRTLIHKIEKSNNKVPVMMSSSIQASLNNPYGNSKKAGENLLFKYGHDNNVSVMVFRFPNVFGKWSRPNYNSAVATFCFNISRDLPIKINNPLTQLNLVYIDDVVHTLTDLLENPNQYKTNSQYFSIPTSYNVELGEMVELLYSFKKIREDLSLPNLDDDFSKKLYSTYLSFLPENNFSYTLKMNEDERGSFTEFIRTKNKGQVSVNISKPGIKKGEHWHHTKNEKFLVVSGEGVIRFRRIDSSQVIEYYVTGEKLEVVDIPPGYTHNIENVGKVDLVTVMWVNESYNPNQPDTYFSEV